jgi:predicted porin
LGGNVGGNVMFSAGPFAATLAAQKVKGKGTAPTLVSQESVLLGASYDLKVVKLFAEYATHDTDLVAGVDSDTKIYQLGVSAPIGPGTLMAQYGNSKADYTVGTDMTNKTLALGYVYNLSKRTNLYGVYLNDKLTGVSSGNTFALGVRHSF